MLRREQKVEARFLERISRHSGPESGLTGPPDAPIVPGSGLDRRTAVHLFECALQSRLQDFEARRLKDKGLTFYTIGSSGHEANAVFGHLLRTDDPALLHYRSGGFMAARARRGRGETPLFDTALSFAASAEDPISGGRHKVWGSESLWVPPQTSTIASHLPKAVGMAYALARMARLDLTPPISPDAIVYCSFGDASSNHATAQAGFTAAAAATMHRQPCPVLFVCEDNGIGISVRTPEDYVQRCFEKRPGLDYFTADGRDLAQSHDVAKQAIDHCRRTRRPVFFHLRTVRLLGHAGSDVETVYRTEQELDMVEERDPLLAFADLLLRTGAIEKAQMMRLLEDLTERVALCAEEASTRPKLQTAAEVRAPLDLPESAPAPRVASQAERERIFHGRLPELEERPRHLAFRISQGLRDVMAAHPETFVFGEDVARKGGVYHVTNGLHEAFGGGRVFNTILDETTILGLAQGLAQMDNLPIPEIQYLAYIHNALDQIRGEAASLQFFSEGRFSNPMVIRVAGYGYQKGFGGHFHNDNSIGALLDIPGLVIASPSRGDDAVGMLRSCVELARQHGKVCLFLEPIALYMQKDLHEKGDGLWETGYPAPDQSTALGRARVYGEGKDLTIVSWANGLHMSLRAQKILAEEWIDARVVDLRWLAPLPIEDVVREVAATGRVLIVDECRETGGGPSAALITALATDPRTRQALIGRVASTDSFVPLGPAANEVLVGLDDILDAARALRQEVDA